MPNPDACRACCRKAAERRSALEGTQPKLRQSPPILYPSIKVTLARVVAAMYDVTKPAAPAPMTTRLRSNRLGLGQRACIPLAFIRATAHRASHGNAASKANDPISGGDRMSDKRVSAPNWVPAFT